MSAEESKDPDPGLTRRLGRVKRICLSIVTIYLIVIVFLVIFELVLVYPVLIGGGKGTNESFEAATGQYEEGFVDAVDGTSIHYAHYRPNTVSLDNSVILFCHGNATWVANLRQFIVALGNSYNISVVAFDYRGYGKSEGLPYEPGILKDADAIYEYLVKQGYKKERIIVYGRSLGGGPACYIASKYKIGGLVLQNTFSSLVDVAAHKFWWLPVRLIMRNRFNSQYRLTVYKGRLLQTHGTADRVVPFHLGKKLFDSVESPSKTFVVDKGGGHNDGMNQEFRDALREFIFKTDDEPLFNPVVQDP